MNRMKQNMDGIVYDKHLMSDQLIRAQNQIDYFHKSKFRNEDRSCCDG